MKPVNVEPFRSYALPIDGEPAEVRRNFRFSFAKFFRGGVKNFADRFSGLTHNKLVCKFRDDPIRDG